MKTTVFITVFALIASVTLAQNQNIEEIDVRAPQFTGTIYKSLNDYLASNIEYPENMKNARIQGTEVIEFTVTANGKVRDFNVINSLSPEFDRQVIQILETTSGKWNPGMANRNLADMKTEVTVTFYLNSLNDMVKTAKDYNRKGNEWLFDKNNPKKALKFINCGINLLPNEESLLAMRCLCNLKLGKLDDAEMDMERIKILAARNGKELNLKNPANLIELTQMAKAISE